MPEDVKVEDAIYRLRSISEGAIDESLDT